MEHEAEPATVHPVRDETGLPDLTAVRAAALFHPGEDVLAHSLRRLAADLAGDADAPLLAAFGNFAPQEPDPY